MESLPTNNPHDTTRQDRRTSTTSAREGNVPPLPDRLGRYQIQGQLGEGGFGTVLLGYDETLSRQVAIKIPRASRFRSQSEISAFTKEAQTVAGLQHPGIVTVFDVGVQDSTPYIVLEYIRGRSLDHCLKHESLDWTLAARIVTEIAEALDHAHDSGFVHRDVKPKNILLDNDDRAHVTDFGLAIRHREAMPQNDELAGTVHYMAPEQVRGESHRVDGRTDIWALGVVFYQMLSGRVPFEGSSTREVFQAILHTEPITPHQLSANVPAELDRICMRCLCRQMSQRYRRALDLANDLNDWLRFTSGGSASGSLRSRPMVLDSPATVVVPRGLRSFDRHDADFFLRLLPGPRDRDGYPTTVRFWKNAVDQRDCDDTFKIGLLYGPSGCGKSSLVKAGLLPRLDSDVFSVLVDAAASDTELRIERALRKKYPMLPAELPLSELLCLLREEPDLREGGKVLIVLDQFEQWLSSWNSSADAELLRAMRQCDGGNVQCIIMVRDDFWLPVSRLLSLLEVSVVDGVNSMLVDSFDMDHARRVLRELGVGYGRLPANVTEQTRQQTAFIEEATQGLTEDGRLYPVRLAVFVEMVKDHEWTPQTLSDMGGCDGVGVAFLESSVGTRASPARRVHEQQARNILAALLPATGQIKDAARTRSELLAVSHYESRPKEFDDLIHLLDVELRLLTRVQTIEGTGDSTVHSVRQQDYPPDGEISYQLTHDFLVPSIREWLERQYRGTRHGRALLMLQQQSETWNRMPLTRYLPTMWEWFGLRLRTTRSDWTPAQARMMSAAGKRVQRTLAWQLAACVMLSVLGLNLYQQNRQQSRNTDSLRLVGQLFSAPIGEVENLMQQIKPYGDLVASKLAAAFGDTSRSHTEHVRAAIGLLPFQSSHVPSIAEILLDAKTPSQEFLAVCKALKQNRQSVEEQMGTIVKNPLISPRERFRAACALATFTQDGQLWEEIGPEVVQSLSIEPLKDAENWIAALKPVMGQLHAPLCSEMLRTTSTESAEILGNALQSQGTPGNVALAQLLSAANGLQFRAIMGLLQKVRPKARDMVREAYETRIANTANTANNTNLPDKGVVSSDTAKTLNNNTEDGVEQSKAQIANLIVALLILGDHQPFEQAIAPCSDPDQRTCMIHHLGPDRMDGLMLITWLTSPEGSPEFENAIRLALLQHVDRLPEGTSKKSLIADLTQDYSEDADPETHSACEVLLRKLNVDLKPLATKLIGPEDKDRSWFVDESGQTMIVLDPTSFSREGYTPPAHLNYRFALANTELTLERYTKYDNAFLQESSLRVESPEVPLIELPHHIARYCNSLTIKCNLDPDECCYDTGPDAPPGMPLLVKDFQTKLGYRLPLSSEWEFACRAGTITPTFYGRDTRVVDAYVWCNLNAGLKLQIVGTKMPNPFGLMDMFGNASEICHLDSEPSTLVRRGEDCVARPSELKASDEIPHAVKIKVQYQGYRLLRRLTPHGEFVLLLRSRN
ncbi:MAG: protein kinase [Pirellulaceae bacterium]|nr:protein kinase [Pirellulaceae bacterium]